MASLVIDTKRLSAGVSYPSYFQLDASFFAAFGNEDIQTAALQVTATVIKNAPQLLQVGVVVEGQVEVPCDRCLDPVALPVDWSASLTEEEVEEALDSESGTLDLTQYVYDSVCVSLPLQRVHEEGACNPEMLAQWQKHMGTAQENAHGAGEDSAFAALKDLKL